MRQNRRKGEGSARDVFGECGLMCVRGGWCRCEKERFGAVGGYPACKAWYILASHPLLVFASESLNTVPTSRPTSQSLFDDLPRSV